MIPVLVKSKQEALEELSRQYGVLRLELFGSASSGDFDSTRSDLDFLVEFSPCSPSEHYDRYFGLMESLRGIFTRRIDLVELKAVRNPHLMRRINESRSLIYDA